MDDEKEYIREAQLIEYEGKTIIGVGIKETFDIVPIYRNHGAILTEQE